MKTSPPPQSMSLGPNSDLAKWAGTVGFGNTAEAAGLGLLALMTSISEDSICVGWLIGLETNFWRAEPGKKIGSQAISERQALLLRLLSDEAGGWWTWSESLGQPEFLSLEAWHAVCG